MNRTRRDAAAAGLIREECDLLAGSTTRGRLGAAFGTLVIGRYLVPLDKNRFYEEISGTYDASGTCIDAGD